MGSQQIVVWNFNSDCCLKPGRPLLFGGITTEQRVGPTCLKLCRDLENNPDSHRAAQDAANGQGLDLGSEGNRAEHGVLAFLFICQAPPRTDPAWEPSPPARSAWVSSHFFCLDSLSHSAQDYPGHYMKPLGSTSAPLPPSFSREHLSF